MKSNYKLFSSQFVSRKDTQKHRGKKSFTQSELLAPVGDFKNLYAAVEAGADAVYFGIKGFNMRTSAKNFSVRDLGKIRRICNDSLRKPKMYLTLNTIVYDGELKKLENIVKAVRGKVDAIICWDLSVIELCRRYGVPFHVSTQASVSNVVVAKFYKNLGAERIVLARELNLKQIKEVSKVVGVECFCHGAMCVAISGRCFTSQFVHGISANRGQCAQPCRRAWEVKDDAGNKLKLVNNRVMSAKDLCTLPFIEDMKRAGVSSFKIEGRNRSPEYVYAVVSEYRRALDNKLSRTEIFEGIARLKKVYNRGFSSGFYLRMPKADDFSFSENGEQEERKEFVGNVGRYWPKAGAASVMINAGRLKVGDNVYLISKDAPIQRVVVRSIEFKGEDVKVAKKGQEVGVDFGVVVRRGDEVYVIRSAS